MPSWEKVQDGWFRQLSRSAHSCHQAQKIKRATIVAAAHQNPLFPFISRDHNASQSLDPGIRFVGVEPIYMSTFL